MREAEKKSSILLDLKLTFYNSFDVMAKFNMPWLYFYLLPYKLELFEEIKDKFVIIARNIPSSSINHKCVS